jgi:hypothetical protein
MNTTDEKLKNNLSTAQKESYAFAASTLLQNDKDLYRLCLYEKDTQKKHALFAIFALLSELEKVRLIAGEQQIGTLRLKWWYDSINADNDSKEEQTQLLQALKTSIQKKYLDKDALLNLIEICSQDITLPTHPELDTFTQHIKKKSENLANAITIDSDIAYNLLMVRAARYFHLEDYPLRKKSIKDRHIFETKLNIYANMLRNNIKKKSKPELSLFDLFKLHFY